MQIWEEGAMAGAKVSQYHFLPLAQFTTASLSSDTQYPHCLCAVQFHIVLQYEMPRQCHAAQEQMAQTVRLRCWQAIIITHPYPQSST